MAFNQVQTVLRLWHRDREGTEDYTRLCFPLTWGQEAAIDLANGAFASTVASLSDCPLCASDIEFLYIDDTPPAGLAAPLDEAEQAGTLFFITNDPDNSRFALDIPGLVAAYLADGVELDRTQPAVAALIAEMTAAGANRWINPWGAGLVSCDVGMRRYLPLPYRDPTG